MLQNPKLGSLEDRRVAVERGARSARDFDGKNLADVAGRSFENDDLVRAGAPGESLGVVATGTFAEDFHLRADERIEFRGDMAIYDLKQILVPRFLYLLRDLSLHRGGGGVLAGRISKDKGVIERDRLAQVAGFLEILIRLTREADNDIAGDRHAGTRGANTLGEFLEFLGGVASAHDF